MAITYPLNLLAGFPGWTIGFDLKWRQEQSTQASGRVLVKDLGSPLWTLRATTRSLSPNKLDQWRARLTSLENGLQDGFSAIRCRAVIRKPTRTAVPGRPGSAFSGTCVLKHDRRRSQNHFAASATSSALCCRSAITFRSRGDLHQVMETATAAGGGATSTFEVRPHGLAGLSPRRTLTSRSSNRLAKWRSCQGRSHPTPAWPDGARCRSRRSRRGCEGYFRRQL